MDKNLYETLKDIFKNQQTIIEETLTVIFGAADCEIKNSLLKMLKEVSEQLRNIFKLSCEGLMILDKQ